MLKILKYSFVLFIFLNSQSISKENFFIKAKSLFDEGKLNESKFLFQ